MRRLVLLLGLAALGWLAVAGVRQLTAAQPAGTPTRWPAVPRNPAG